MSTSDDGLASGTAYMVRVNSGLEDTTGSALEQDYVLGIHDRLAKSHQFLAQRYR